MPVARLRAVFTEARADVLLGLTGAGECSASREGLDGGDRGIFSVTLFVAAPGATKIRHLK